MAHHPSTETSPEAKAKMLALYREMSPTRKLELVDDAIKTSRQLLFAGLKHRYPDESVASLRWRLAKLVLGDELAETAYGSRPDFDFSDES